MVDKVTQAESIAKQLQDKFKAQDISYPFYCKVALHLPENVIWNLYEQAQTGREPAKLFNFLTRKLMK